MLRYSKKRGWRMWVLQPRVSLSGNYFFFFAAAFFGAAFFAAGFFAAAFFTAMFVTTFPSPESRGRLS
jgi:hypothetical protein